jgi:error-prone DNA polymerase
MRYTELQVTSNFTFLRGASHPEELVERAAALGYSELAINDWNTLAGIVRAHSAAKKMGIRIIVSCRLELLDGPPLLIFPTNKEAYARLSSMLSEGNLRAEKGQCRLYKADVYRNAEGMKFIAVPPTALNSDFKLDITFCNALKEYKQHFGSALYIAANRSYLANDNKRLFRLAELSKELAISLVATNDVHYHHSARRELQDVLTCVREKCTIQNAGFKLYQNAERYLKALEEVQRLFTKYPEAIEATQKISDACQFSLDELKYVYPKEITSEGRTPQQELEHLTWAGAEERFSGKVPDNVKATIEMELTFIRKKDYASYFLTVYDYVREANQRGILCQGRGSAANSVVCYCIGITAVNPAKFKLLFARFMSDARDEPPDIDVDFEHERREEIMQYIYAKYGRDRAGIVATVTQVHWKGAVRDVGKAMGLSVDAIDHLSKSHYEFTGGWYEGKNVSSEGFDAKDLHLRKVLDLTSQYIGFPRQLGQHTGGFVISHGKLTELCPVLNARMEDRTNIEWNKDDIEALGFMKVDVLALGMLTCIRKAFDLAKQHYNLDLTLANIPQDDPKVYEMVSHADTIGVFQIESRAQMSMLPRLKPKCFYDLVIEVAIVRPGPIQGDMVHPYLRRREGKDPVEYPSKELEEILGRTLGVPLFQEQAMEIAIVAAGFTPTEADGLRRSMATFKAKGKVSDWERKLITGMIAKGYKEDFAKRVFRQLEGFGSYGFPESHAASFALLVYVSSWIKCYYPDVFAAALLNSMPMGFYQPAQIVIDAQKHGVEVLPIDINYSKWDNTLEHSGDKWALRLGFRQAKGLKQDEMDKLGKLRDRPFNSIVQIFEEGITQATLEQLAHADVFRSIGMDRRKALWEVSALDDRPTDMFKGQKPNNTSELDVTLPKMSPIEHVVQDFSSTSLSLKAHPISFVREKLSRMKVTCANDLASLQNDTLVRVAGLVLVRQRPGTASGVVFVTLEDETGNANLVVFSKKFDKYRKEIVQSKLLMVQGKLQKEGEVIHVIVQQCFNMNGLLSDEIQSHQELSISLSIADEKDGGGHAKERARHVKAKSAQTNLFPDGRNFR